MTGSGDAASSASVFGEVVIRVRDHGPAPRRHSSGEPVEPWCRFEADLPSYPVVSERGVTPWEAVFRLVGMHRAVLERRWSGEGFDAPKLSNGVHEPPASRERSAGSWRP